MQSFIDIGVNLMHSSFNRDREEIIKKAKEQGVSKLIISGGTVEGSAEAADYASLYPETLYSTAGIHPHEAKTWCDSAKEGLQEIAKKECVRAIGECGLDYNRNFSPPDLQRLCFERHIALAEECGLPLFVHERDAFTDVYALLRANRYKSAAVIHCFTGTERELEEYLALGCYIGITGWICDERRGRHLLDLVKLIPYDRLMLETDAPFLLPRTLDVKVGACRNEPRFLPHIASFIAKHLNKDISVLAQETYTTGCHFFGITPVCLNVPAPASGFKSSRVVSKEA